MALKAVVENLEDVPENLREQYTLREGKYYLSIEGEPDGFVAKARHNEFRNNNITLQQKLEAAEKERQEAADKLKGFEGLDAEKYKNLLAKEEELNKGKQNQAAATQEQIQEAVKAAMGPLSAKVDELSADNKRKDAELTKTRFEGRLKDAATAAKCNDGAEAFLIQQAERDGWQYEGDALVRMQSGTKVLSADRPGEPQNIDEYLAEQRKANPWAFKESSGGGSQNEGQKGQPRQATITDPYEFGKNLEDIAKGKVIVNQ